MSGSSSSACWPPQFTQYKRLLALCTDPAGDAGQALDENFRRLDDLLDYLFGTVEEGGVWDDLRVPVESTTRGGSKVPTFDKVLDNGLGSQGVFLPQFSATTEEELYFSVQLPHNWVQGTDLHAHVHWLPMVNGSAGQRANWGLEYTWAAVGTTFGSTQIISGNVPSNDETLVAKRHYLTAIGTISGSGITGVSSMLLCRIFRDATGSLKTDDYGSLAALMEIDFHYLKYGLGSRQEYIV